MARRSLTWVVGAVLAVTLPLAGVPAAAEEPDTEVAGRSPLPAACASSQPEAEDEVHLAATGGDAAVAVWAQGLRSGLAWSRTTDGGRTWAPSAVLPGWTRCTGGPGTSAANPRVSAAPDGTAWVVGTAADEDDAYTPAPLQNVPTDLRLGRVLAAALRPGAAAWSAATSVSVGAVDSPAVAALDARRAVVAWADPSAGGIFSRTTTDGGQTWSLPVLVHGLQGGGTRSYPHLAVAANGSLALVVRETGRGSATAPDRVERYFSTDEGRSWTGIASVGPSLTGDVSLTRGEDGRVHLALAGPDRLQLLASRDGFSWQQTASLPAQDGAPEVSVAPSGEQHLATLVARPAPPGTTGDDYTAVCVTRLDARGAVLQRGLVGPVTRARSAGDSPYSVRPDVVATAGGPLLLDIRRTGPLADAEPRVTEVRATRLAAGLPADAPGC